MAHKRRVDIEHETRLLNDFFKVDAVTLRHEKFNGEMTESLRRLSFERGDAAAAIIVERESGDVLLTEQFRLPTHAKGPGWIVEAAAGMVEDGEDPAQAVRREILEEMGYSAATLEYISSFYVSPGGSSERIFLYFAEVSASGRIKAGGGLTEEGEDIRVVRLPSTDIRAALDDDRFSDAKTLIGLMWLLNRRS